MGKFFGEVIGGRIAHPPGFGKAALVLAGQARDDATYVLFIIDDPKAPVGVHDFSLRVYFDACGAWSTGGRPAHYSRSAGAEWVSDLSLFYILNIRLILGAAHGFDTQMGGENQVYGALEVPL